MRVLQILPELNVGGVETGTIDFAAYLVKNGHQSFVISDGGPLVRDLESGGSKHFALPVHKKSLWTMFKMVKAVRKIIRAEKIDVVHARSRVPAWIAYFACRKTNAAFITTCHGYYQGRFFSQIMGWPKFVIVPGHVIGRHMIEDFKVRPERIRCIPRSVDLSRFKLRLPRKVKGRATCTIAIVGRITPLKGHEYFLRAMAQVIRTVPYARILVIGDAPQKKKADRDHLEQLVQRLGLRENVSFLGNRKDIPQLLAEVDVLVLSTITQESFGRVILEAQAMHVPVVATNVGGVIDIIDDERTGLLVMPKDPEAMAIQVLRLVRDKDLAQRVVQAALKKLKSKFTVEHMCSQTLRVYEELVASMNILVIKMSSIGDVVLVVPSLKALRKKFPGSNIYCVVGKASAKILQRCPYLDGLFIYDHEDRLNGWLNLVRLAGKLRRYKFDKIIDFQNNRRSHLLSYLSWPQESYGFKNGKWSFFLTYALKDYKNDIPAVRHQFQILDKLGVHYNDRYQLELWPSEKDKKYAKELLEVEWLGNCKRLVGLNISASDKWQTKNWPLEHMAKLCDLLTAQNIRIMITGTEKDRKAVNQLLLLTKAKPAVFIAKTDVLQLAALIKKCHIFITPDSAPLHIASAMKVPAIVFFGPTDPNRHLPPGKEIVVIKKELECAPCYKGRCPILTHSCMRDIQPEEVAEIVDRYMPS